MENSNRKIFDPLYKILDKLKRGNLVNSIEPTEAECINHEYGLKLFCGDCYGCPQKED
jgi:hypothetical protein